MKLSLLQSYLLAERLVGRDELQRVEAERLARGLTFPSALLALKVLDAEALAAFLARRFKLPRVDAVELTAAKVAHQLEPTFALERRVLPVAREGDVLTLVMSDPTDSETAEDVERRTRATVVRAVALESALDAALARHYGGGALQGEATGELRDLFGTSRKVDHPEEGPPIPLTRRKAPAPAPALSPQSTDHLENLVTAPLPRIDFTPGQEPPPLPPEFQEPPPLPDDDPPPPPDALSPTRTPVDAGAGRERHASKVKKKTQPFPSLATGELVDEFEVSREIPSTSRAPDARPKVDPQLPTTLVDKLPEQAWSAAQLQGWALDWLSQLAGRTLLFRVHGRELRGWAAAGLGVRAASTLGLTIDERSLFAEVLQEGSVYVGPLPFGPTERRFAALVGRHPRELLLAPVSDAEGPVGLVYCDDLHAAVRPRELEGFIKRLAEHLRRGDQVAP